MRTPSRLAPILVPLLAVALLFPAFASAQVAANLYGYEKAPWVAGTVQLLGGERALELRGFSSHYSGAFTLLLTCGFDLRQAVTVGEVPPGFSGDLRFDLPAGAEGKDSVILLAPGSSDILGLGVLR